MRRAIERGRPYWLHAYLLVFTPMVLYLDSRAKVAAQQAALGLVTFLVLWLCSLRLPRESRAQIWVCVVIATGFEILGSQVWGVYRYRWHNIPLYVPPGHGLVYLFGVTAAALPVFRRHGRRAALVVLAACTAWAVAGLIVLPQLTHRVDVQGALCWPVFAFCVLYTRRYALFAAIFLATTDLELSGTLAGDWTWAPVAPWTHLASGNPPSAIAGGYSVIDGSVALAVAVLFRLGWLGRRRAPAVSVPAEPEPAAA